MPTSSCSGFAQGSGESTPATSSSGALRAHVKGCAHCAGAVPLLDDEVAALAIGGERAGDQMTVRRVRRRLLQDLASVALDRRELELRRRRVLRGVLGAALGALAFLVGSSLSNEQPADFLATVSPGDGPPATWSRTVDGGFERLNLHDGAIAIRVRPHRASETLAVQVPDGSIEDRGTKFEVVVRGGRTTRITVGEGRVAFNLLGIPERILTAGERWERPAAAPLPQPAAGARLVVQEPPVVARERAPAPRHRGSLRARPSTSIARESSDTHPEDVAYLRVIRLLRAARTSEAALAARHYLENFPRGFRAEEMRTIVERGAGDPPKLEDRGEDRGDGL